MLHAVLRPLIQVIWVKGFIKNLDIGLENGLVKVFCDNKDVIALIKNCTLSFKSKYIDANYHYVHDGVEKGVVKVDSIHTRNMLADPMTKGLSHKKFKWHIENMELNTSMVSCAFTHIEEENI